MAMETTRDRPGSQTATTRRRFRVADIMILVAATAIGCAFSQGISAATGGELSWQAVYKDVTEVLRGPPFEGWLLTYLHLLTEFVVQTSPFIASWTVAFMAIRLLGPRPRWRRVARQPGMIAACASLLSLALFGSIILGAMLASTFSGYAPDFFTVTEAVYFSHLFVSMSILVSWMTLLLGRRWRAEPSWIDRLGRALAVSWIVGGLLVASVLILPAIPQPLPHYSAYRPGPAAQGEPALQEPSSDPATR